MSQTPNVTYVTLDLDLTVDSYIAHDFDELYELLENAEPEFQRKNIMYEVRQCGDEEKLLQR